ncbi:MAG: hypothetical protein MZV70_59265 [Desulfobacterales bacterium]|nr:hypothetical protein [Desulfobacterales bacterium]
MKTSFTGSTSSPSSFLPQGAEGGYRASYEALPPEIFEELGKNAAFIDGIALDILKAYNWPGNIRELQNIIERAILISDDGTISKEHLPESVRGEQLDQAGILAQGLSIEDYTKTFILRYQDEYTEQQLADMLGITRKALWEKRKRWGMARD